MALARVLEPEVMDSEQEARDYDAMGHGDVNAAFCDDMLKLRPEPARLLDVGTGTGLIPVALCARVRHTRVVGLDLSVPMLTQAWKNVSKGGLRSRVALVIGDATAMPWEDGAFEVVISNSIVHHIPEPARIFAEILRVTAKGGLVFVRDSLRPKDEAGVRSLVAKHAAIPPEVKGEERAMHERQRDLFEASLRAALTEDEVRACIRPLGVSDDALRVTSDRHWTVSHVKA